MAIVGTFIVPVKVKGMISELTRRILSECRLRQKDLADLLGVPIQRVKRLSGGDVSKFTREEGEALIRKLNIRAEWLVTGEGEMFQTPEEKDFGERLDTLSWASKEAAKLTDNPAMQSELQKLLVDIEVARKKEMEKMLAEKLSTAVIKLSEREKHLLANYRGSSEEGRRAVESTASALAHRDGAKQTDGSK